MIKFLKGCCLVLLPSLCFSSGIYNPGSSTGGGGGSPSGSINAANQFSLPYYSLVGSSNILRGFPGTVVSTNTGVFISTVAASSATFNNITINGTCTGSGCGTGGSGGVSVYAATATASFPFGFSLSTFSATVADLTTSSFSVRGPVRSSANNPAAPLFDAAITGSNQPAFNASATSNGGGGLLQGFKSTATGSLGSPAQCYAYFADASQCSSSNFGFWANSGDIGGNNLTANLPLQTNASKALISSQISLSSAVVGVLPVANGGTGTASPSLVAGTNITSITGTWPNQTINAATQSGGGGSTGGTINAANQFSLPYYSLVGSSNILSNFPDATVSTNTGVFISTLAVTSSATFTNTTITATGTVSALKISANGTYGNTIGSSGGLFMDCTGGGTTSGMCAQLYTNAGAQGALGGLLNLFADNSAWNEPFIYTKRANSTGNNSDIRIDAKGTPAFTMVETGQANASAGKFQWSVHNGTLRLESRNAADSAFDSRVVISSVPSGGTVFIGTSYGVAKSTLDVAGAVAIGGTVAGGTIAPVDGLLVQGSILNQALAASNPVQTDSNKNLISAQISLSTAVTGILSVANGGAGTLQTQVTAIGVSTASLQTQIISVAVATTTLGANFPLSLSTGAVGVLQAAQEPAHTGETTNTAGSLVMSNSATQANIKTFTSSITVTTQFQASSITASQNGAAANGLIPGTPLQVVGNVNGVVQSNVQNYSTGNNATQEYMATSSLGGSTSNYMIMGINGSGYNQTTFSAIPSTAGYILTGDHSLIVGAGINGSDSGAAIVLVTSNPIVANTRMVITSTGSMNIYTPINLTQTLGSNSLAISSSASGSPMVSVSSTAPVAPTDFLLSISSANGVLISGNQYNGHVVSSGTTPVLSSCGTTPGLRGTDAFGTITGGATSGGCTLTFNNAYSVAPSCVVTERAMSLVNSFQYTVSATALTITQTGFGTSIVDYSCTLIDAL